jgi:spermidine synthase
LLTGNIKLPELLTQRIRVVLLEPPTEVIDWHQNRLVPMGKALSEDKRCEMRKGNFFELVRTGFDITDNARKFDAVLLDIDHSPEHFLDEKNKSFYGVEGLNSLRKQIKENGVFALWSK